MKTQVENMFTNKKVIIFDMDGTIIDSVGVWNEVDMELIRQLGNVSLTEDEVQRKRDEKLREYSKTESPYLEYCKYLGETYHSVLSPEEIHTLRYDIANDFLIHKVDYKPDVAKVLRCLKDRGLTLAIATTTRKKNMDIYRHQNENLDKKAKIDDYFTLIYTREDAKEMKPNPEIYLKVMEKLQVKPEECLVFEDSLIGVEAACNAGMEVVAVYDRYSDGEKKDIKRLATYYVKSYSEIIRDLEETEREA